MELRQLRYVVAVAEEGHFGRAAERLCTGQPAVSQQVRRLERELGIDLFDRTPRGVRLTAAGELFLPEARAVLAAQDRARAVAARLAGEYTGTLRLGTSRGLGERLAAVLERLRWRAPHLEVDLVAAPTRVRLDQVAAGTLDATFLRGTDVDGACRAIEVWEDPLVVALPARHELGAGAGLGTGADAEADPGVALADLAALPLRLVPRARNPVLVDLVLHACRDAGFQPVPSPLTGSTLEDTLAAIGAGTPTWTVLYAAHAQGLHAPRVAFRTPRGTRLSVPTSLCVRATAPTPYLPLLLDACAAAGHHDS
ncbi:LysR family transcriptional regulator [Frankia sp. AgPm24]|uniref:LysR family transcriptional regulator n=2 Tax=Frankia TaxID=1854 RepID=A0ABT0K2N6_9ACTN|nr:MULTISPECIES: LysR family transcriptional regulator [Frankia]MCK9877752.1 LysR family transcriptional regulator [Frankia umida]MCK9925254.1 LysR family transcriptional regulator [Frankia sp. AgPm24]